MKPPSFPSFSKPFIKPTIPCIVVEKSNNRIQPSQIQIYQLHQLGNIFFHLIITLYYDPSRHTFSSPQKKAGSLRNRKGGVHCGKFSQKNSASSFYNAVILLSNYKKTKKRPSFLHFLVTFLNIYFIKKSNILAKD